ncbi:uncharacterized protein, partial [Halyomorpha halys]|uniref:uncharacterized protein n=1 Tax=Halyomorpha halys TaxID=286706 RepID=UPI0034D1620C
MYNRLLLYVEQKLGDHQGGFRPNRSTINQIFALRQISEKMKEHQQTTWMLFIDFRAAYDTIMVATHELGLPSKLTRLVKCTMVSTTCQVKSCGLSEPFEVEYGLRQDPIAPLLFNIALQVIINRAGINQEGIVFTKMTQVLAYADDVVIIRRPLQRIRTAFEAMDVEAKRMGLPFDHDYAVG